MKCVKAINETSLTFSFKYPLVWSQIISRIIKYIDTLIFRSGHIFMGKGGNKDTHLEGSICIKETIYTYLS